MGLIRSRLTQSTASATMTTCVLSTTRPLMLYGRLLGLAVIGIVLVAMLAIVSG